MRLRKVLPHIKRIILQSDNAKCYMSSDLLLAIPILSMVHGIYIVRYIHTETQDGKSLLDAHFATATRWVKEYLKLGNNAATSSQLVGALSSNGGLPNSTVSLIRHNRERLKVLITSLSLLSHRLSSIKKRTNEIVYHYSNSAGQIQSFENMESVPDFSLTCFSYSSAGEGSRISVSPSAGTCRMENGNSLESRDGGSSYEDGME